MKNISL